MSQIADSVGEACQGAFFVGEGPFYLGVSMGISLFLRDGQAPEVLLRKADMALHLDPDHIPVSWQTDLGIDGEFWQGSRKMFVGWTVDQNTRMNTASSIEREIHILPALVGGFEGSSVRASLKGGVGYVFLEIDDDAPRLGDTIGPTSDKPRAPNPSPPTRPSASERRGRSSFTPRSGGTATTGSRTNASPGFRSRRTAGPRAAR